MEQNTLNPTVLALPEIFVYLGADRFVSQGNLLNGVNVPGEEGRWKLGDLATTIVASVFWALRRQGAMELEWADKKGLIFHHGEMRVKAADDFKGELQGLSAKFYGFAKQLEQRDSKFLNVGGVFRLWLDVDITQPWGFVCQATMAEAKELGYLKHHMDAKGRDDILHAEAIPEKADEIHSGAQALSAAWHDFLAKEPEFSKHLMDEARKAIASRTDTTDTSPA